MRRSDFMTPVTNLQEAYETLEIAWRECRELGSDSAALHFEENYLRHVRPSVEATVNGAGQMSTVLGKAVRECSDHQDRSYL